MSLLIRRGRQEQLMMCQTHSRMPCLPRPPDNVQILVCRLDDKLGNLFILSDKKNGLYSLHQFPASSDKEIFYYPERAKVGRNSPKAPKERKSKWMSVISEFRTTWLHENSSTIPDHFHESNREQPSPIQRPSLNSLFQI